MRLDIRQENDWLRSELVSANLAISQLSERLSELTQISVDFNIEEKAGRRVISRGEAVALYRIAELAIQAVESRNLRDFQAVRMCQDESAYLAVQLMKFLKEQP